MSSFLLNFAPYKNGAGPGFYFEGEDFVPCKLYNFFSEFEISGI